MSTLLTMNPKATPRQPHSLRSWAIRISLGFLAFILTSAIGILIAGAIARANLYAAYPAPGQLVDVGGYRLHIACQGSGSGSSVILDAGTGATSLDWALVQPQVAKFSQVCTYDRAGVGWSNASPQPRNFAVMVEELHTLLERAGLKGPFVLVGHSIGGIVTRQYAAKYPKQVAGLVLVDSAHEQQFRRFPKDVVKSTVAGIQQSRGFETLIGLGIPALFPALVPLEPRLPKTAAQAYRALMTSDPKHVTAGVAEIEELIRGGTKPVATLGNLPLVVLSHGHQDPGMVMTTTDAAQYERTWTQLQLELTGLSSRGQRVVATQSGHSIQLDQPELVVGAIREVLTPRKSKPAP